MATNKQLKFFKGASAPAAPATGMIWFCTDDRTIRVYTGAEWEKYAGLVNANWNGTDKLLTITNAAGVETKLDLSDCASAKDITAKLTTINNTLTSHDGRITTAQGAAEAAQAHSEGVASDLAAEVKLRGEEITRVEGLISAEASRADAAEKANAAAAKAADDKAAAAQTYAEGVNTALGQEVTRATGKEDELAGEIETLKQAIGAGGSVESQIVAKIGDLDATVGSQTVAEGKHVAVEVVETDGKLTGLTVVESDIASAQALADEIANRGVAEQGLSNRIEALAAAETGRVTVLEKKVDALNSATHFEGKVEGETFEAAIAASGKTFEAGDIVIYVNKEFIYDGEAWIELGDTTAESGRISSLEAWKTEASQAIADNKAAIESNDVDIKALQDADAAQAELNATLATKQELANEKAALNALIEANGTAITALQGADTTINGRLDGLDGDVERIDGVLATLATSEAMTQLTNRVVANEAAIERLDGEQATQNQNISAADAKGQKGIDDAAAALAEAKAKVASVEEGNDYVTIGGTATVPTVSVNVVGQIAEGNIGLVTGGAIFNELCWVEFE